VRAGEVEQLVETRTETLGVRVFLGQRSAVAYSSDLGADALARVVEEAVELARLAGVDPCAGLPDDPAAEGGDRTTDDLCDPDVLARNPQDAIALARECEAAARGYDPRITGGEGATATRQEETTALATSRGFAGTYRSTTCALWVNAIADDADHKKRWGDWFVETRGFPTPEVATEAGRRAGARAVQQIGSRKPATQEVPVVWAPEVAREFVAILGFAATGEARYRGESFLIDREGERLAPSFVSIVDDATLPGRVGSRPFDAEGLPARATPLLDGGVFGGFLFDSYSARRCGRHSTGNAMRNAQTGMLPLPAPTHLQLAAGPTPAAAIVVGVERGVYLTGTLGFGENLATGDFSRGAYGVWIEDGELAYPIDEFNIAGRLQEMLADIDAVGDDLMVAGNLAAPTFRIGRMVVSGT
jgi:PmbA protein